MNEEHFYERCKKHEIWLKELAEFPQYGEQRNNTPPSGRRLVVLNEYIQGYDLSKRNLEGAVIANSTIEHTDFSGAGLNGVKITGSTIRLCTFEGANMDYLLARGSELSRCTIKNSTLRGAVFETCDMRKITIETCSAPNITMRMCNLAGASFQGTTFLNGNFHSSELLYADFGRANLSGVNLHGTNLYEVNLASAMYERTELSWRLHREARNFAKLCPPVGRHGGRIVYRTSYSMVHGQTNYRPGKTYTAPYLSYSPTTPCHPGIYASATLARAKRWGASVVKCYVRDGDYVVSDKGVRCKRLRVLSRVN